MEKELQDLLETLQSPLAKERYNAAKILAEFGTLRPRIIITKLKELLKEEKHPKVKDALKRTIKYLDRHKNDPKLFGEDP
jgi:hypothetical protein